MTGLTFLAMISYDSHGQEQLLRSLLGSAITVFARSSYDSLVESSYDSFVESSYDSFVESSYDSLGQEQLLKCLPGAAFTILLIAEI